MNRDYTQLTSAKRQELLAQLRSELDAYRQKGLKLDMSRGKPSKEQLDLSDGLLACFGRIAAEKGAADYRNYGILDGVTELKTIFCDMLKIRPSELIVAGNASLNLMYDAFQRAMQFGLLGNPPWNEQGKIKWLCPVPGYDRHFAVSELFGAEMINIEMTPEGPDMDAVEELVKDPSVKGIWCVPKYSNPQGIVYSDAVVRRFAALKPAAPDFRIFWDNAYMVHSLTEEGDVLLDLFAEAKRLGNEDIVYQFGSTSKITYAGAGVGFIVASERNIAEIKSRMTIQTIGPDKINQYAHALFFGNAEGIYRHMDKHRALLKPKFDAVDRILTDRLAGAGIAAWTKPRGGYFISVDLLPGTAKRTVALCKEAGVIFTGAGATYPYKKDPADANIRIAPSLPPVEELVTATEIFCTAAKIAALEVLEG